MTKATGILRYPYEAITEETDYLQLAVYSYDTSGYGTGNLTANQNFVNQNTYSAQNIAGGVNKAKVLGEGGIIMLPMPSNIQDFNSVSYDGDTLNGIVAAGLNAYTTMTADDLVQTNGVMDIGQTTLNIGKNLVKGAKEFFDNVGDKDLIMKALSAQALNVFNANVSVNSLLARSGGKVLNPNMELLFNNVTLRTFRFSFKMTPRDENEATSIKSIIRTLKKNMAAKRVGEGTNDGLFLKTPNIFELTYMKGNKKHPFLNRFKPCALSDMSVNYTGDNVYATYGDGTPISIILDLTFKELVPIYEDDYNDSAFNTSNDNGSVFDSNFKDDDLIYGVTGYGNNAVQDDVEGVGY